MRLLYHLLNYSLLFFKEKTINHSIYQSNPFPKPKTYNMENTIIYIVCNPSSGGNKGDSVMKLDGQKIDFANTHVTLKIYDIRKGDSGKKECFLQIKEDIKNCRLDLIDEISDEGSGVKDSDSNINPIRVIMAGGDGTVMWGMMELGNHEIDPKDIAVGCLPLGTGNDWSRAMGWGGFFDTSFTNKDLKVLKSWVTDILMADLYNFDLWEVNISLKDNGHFSQIKDGVSHILKEKEDKSVIKKLNKMCCNYFSTGVESRIGFGFEKRRTKSQMLNKFFYGTESIKKFLFKKSCRINDYVKSIKCQNSANEQIIIKPKNDFKSNPLSLIFQNIPSMASGCDFWSGSFKNSTKLDKIKKKHEEEGVYKNIQDDVADMRLLTCKQEIGDKKIELLTIKELSNYSKAQMGLLKGVAKRVSQGEGPFLIEFIDSYKEKIYFQIDGENYACVNPKEFEVKYSKSYAVLIKKGSKLTQTSVQSQISKSEFIHDRRKDTIVSSTKSPRMSSTKSPRNNSSVKEVPEEVKAINTDEITAVFDETPTARTSLVLTEPVLPLVPISTNTDDTPTLETPTPITPDPNPTLVKMVSKSLQI
mmetsp:Transcript_23471/g.22624  ORF Transcript_23471/g.22624 Transcript_23471/m.22624 type:complete len:588 (+) Transcript_23471:40-1803(+)